MSDWPTTAVRTRERGRRHAPGNAPRALALAAAAALASAAADAPAASPWAAQVVRYTAGANATAGYRTPAAALGEPSRLVDDDDFGAWGLRDVTPFVPPFSTNGLPTEGGVAQVVSIGAGGELVVAFDHNVTNDVRNPFGIDLLVFGNAFFIDASADKSGLTGSDTSKVRREPARISVSQDGSTWFDIPDASADDVFPTMGFTDTGTAYGKDGRTPSDFTKPVNPAAVWTSKRYPELRALYDGAGGGTGVDIGKAGLQWIRYVRVWQPSTDTLSAEVDAFSDVAPGTAEWDLVTASAHPVCSPAVGTAKVADGARLQCRSEALYPVGAGTQDVCVGWGGTGSVPGSGEGTSVWVTVTQNSGITWNWQRRIRCEALAAGHGAVAPASLWRDLGGSVTVTAAPDAYAEFAGWSGDTQGDTNAATMTVTMNRARTLTAAFREKLAAHGVPQRWLAAHALTEKSFDEEAGMDRDGDGQAAWEEYFGGTDPRSAASCFRIVGLQAAAGSNAVWWTSGTDGSTAPFEVWVMTNEAAGWSPDARAIPRSAKGTNVWWRVSRAGESRAMFKVVVGRE